MRITCQRCIVKSYDRVVGWSGRRVSSHGARRLSVRGAGAQVSQVGPPPVPSARLAHLPRRSVHRHTPAWRLVLRARRHFLHTLASPTRRLSLLPIAQFPAPSRPSLYQNIRVFKLSVTRELCSRVAILGPVRSDQELQRQQSRLYREVGGARGRRTLGGRPRMRS